MKIKELIEYGKEYLPNHEVNMIIAHLLNIDNLDLLPYLDKTIKESEIEEYKEKIQKVVNKIPIQYVLGNVNFYGYKFKVDKNVLIPRFETEELIENTIEYIGKLFGDAHVDIIDLGCGSGNIGITLKKKLKESSVTCVDISNKALSIAKGNADRLDANITFIQSDMLDNITDNYDVIISNPPYISKDEKIEDIVKNNEPHLALFAENDGLYFYEKILSTCKKNLKCKFLIAFEIGMNQKEKIIELAYKYLDNIEIECKKDMSCKDRMIFIYNK